MLFKDLNIIGEIQRALDESGYEKATSIQEKSIPHSLKGNDILGCAQTGTGKTAAFSIPVIQGIHKSKEENKKIIKALVLAPTRELAIQIGESFDTYSKYTKIKNTVIFGGVSQSSQVRKIQSGVDVLVATPGRLLDLIGQRVVDLKNVEYFILDEADRMLDMGMINDVKKIITKLPKERQNMLFSATMPKEVTKLVNSILKNPVKIEVAPVSSTVDIISQSVYHVGKKYKKYLLIDILKDEKITSLLVFSRTKHGANKIAKDLDKAGITSAAIHGNKSQNARQLALNNFKDGSIRVLVATDIAARGIDIDELSYVINYDLPEVPETYVHRIGRTGRAGHSGIAYSFCDPEERHLLRAIEKLINKDIEVLESKNYAKEVGIVEEQKKEVTSKKEGNSNNKNKPSKRKYYSNNKKSNEKNNSEYKKKTNSRNNSKDKKDSVVADKSKSKNRYTKNSNDKKINKPKI